MEVMIAIVVFWVGILGVLHVMTQNISLIDRSKLKATATLLNKEGMELAFHHRNTNVLLSYNWSCGERDASSNNDLWCDDIVTSGTNTYTIQTDQEWTYTIAPINLSWSFSEIFEKTRLYSHTDTTDNYTIERFDHNQTDGTKTNFARFITYDKIVADDINQEAAKNMTKVTSTTLFSKWTITWEIIFESIMGKRE